MFFDTICEQQIFLWLHQSHLIKHGMYKKKMWVEMFVHHIQCYDRKLVGRRKIPSQPDRHWDKHDWLHKSICYLHGSKTCINLPSKLSTCSSSSPPVFFWSSRKVRIEKTSLLTSAISALFVGEALLRLKSSQKYTRLIDVWCYYLDSFSYMKRRTVKDEIQLNWLIIFPIHLRRLWVST